MIGVYPDNEGYPNVKYRLQAMRRNARYQVNELNLYSQDWPKIVNLVPSLSLIWAHIKLAMGLFHNTCAKKSHCFYIPYPSIFSNFIVRFLYWGKPIISDAFISVYDSAVNDRMLTKGFKAKILFYLEKWSFQCANSILVDTDLNSQHYTKLFHLKQNLFVSSPLYTYEPPFNESRSPADRKKFRVLFIGNMVPLHGVEVIAQTIRILKAHENIEFRVIGDGQDTPKLEKLLQDKEGSVSWIRGWLDEKKIAKEITDSDICLGVFSNHKKAQRVCPYKIYQYAYFEKPIVSALNAWSQTVPKDTILTVAPDDPIELSTAILQLYETASRRELLGKNAKRFYENTLSNELAERVAHQLFSQTYPQK